MKKLFPAKVLAIFLAITMVLLAAGCSRSDPADDIELYWPDDMRQNEEYEGNEGGIDDPGILDEIEYDITPMPPTMSFQTQIKEHAAKNPDTVGWLHLPDTEINEAVVQAENNEKYHRLNSLGEYDFNGCLYADYESRIAGDANQISPNIVIYGHSMTDNPDTDKDEKKFTQLKKLLNKDFAEDHPYIYFSSGTQDYVYEIFSIMYANALDFFYNDCNFAYSSHPMYLTFDELVAETKAGSLFDYPVTPVEGDKIITLSTCTYQFGDSSNTNQRFVVFGRLLTSEDDMPTSITLTENTDAIMPTF